MTAMLSKRDVLPPPCGPTSAMARGDAFILVECSLLLSWVMCASAFENPIAQKAIASGGSPDRGRTPLQMGMLALLTGQCKPWDGLVTKYLAAPKHGQRAAAKRERRGAVSQIKAFQHHPPVFGTCGTDVADMDTVGCWGLMLLPSASASAGFIASTMFDGISMVAPRSFVVS